jgi:hypothetical protein
MSAVSFFVYSRASGVQSGANLENGLKNAGLGPWLSMANPIRACYSAQGCKVLAWGWSSSNRGEVGQQTRLAVHPDRSAFPFLSPSHDDTQIPQYLPGTADCYKMKGAMTERNLSEPDFVSDSLQRLGLGHEKWTVLAV